MSQVFSTTDLKNRVLHKCGELQDGSSQFESKVVEYLNTLYANLFAGGNLLSPDTNESWVWAESVRPIVISLLSSNTTGTVALTADSTSGTFSSAPALSMEGRYLFLESISDVYKIATHTAGATAFSLDQAFLGASASYNFTAAKLDYDLSDDVIVITNKNNKIDFTEGGSDLVATLTNGSYSPSALCTEIDTRLSAAGAGSYTVSFDSIKRKFSIVKSAGTFTIKFGTGSNVYFSAAGILGYENQDYTGALTYSSAYALSAISRITKPLQMYKNSGLYTGNSKDLNKIFSIDSNTFLRDYPIGFIRNGMPDKYCLLSQGIDGLCSIRVNGFTDENTRVEVSYIPVPRSLIDNANSYPLVPSTGVDYLVYGAAYFLAQDKSDGKAPEFLSQAQSQLKAMVNENRKGISLGGQNFGRLVPRPNQLPSPRPFNSGDPYS